MLFNLLLSIIPVIIFSNFVHYLSVCSQVSFIKCFSFFFQKGSVKSPPVQSSLVQLTGFVLLPYPCVYT